MKSKKIVVEGVEYPVLDNLGYQNGHYVKEVEMPDGTAQMAVKASGSKLWRFWTSQDRCQWHAKGTENQ